MAKKKDITVKTPEGEVIVQDPFEYQEPEKRPSIEAKVVLPDEEFFDPYKAPLKPYEENLDNQVRLQNPQGEIETVLKDDKNFFINREGYKELSDEQKKELQLKETYGDEGSSALAGFEGLTKGVSFGLINKGLNALGETIMNPNIMTAAQEARAKANPAAALAGEIAGIGTQFAATGGFGGIGAKTAAKLGLNVDVAAKAAFDTALTTARAGKLPFKEALALANAAKAGELSKLSVYARVGGQALANGIEGAVYQLGDQTVKAIFDDPNQTLGDAAVAIGGLNGFLGGAAFGAAFSGAGQLWNATFGNKVAGNLDEIMKYIKTESQRLEANQYIEAFVPGAPIIEKEIPLPLESILSGPVEGRKSIIEKIIDPRIIIGGRKANATQIEESANRLGIKPTVGMLDSDPYVGAQAEVLSKSPTVEGKLLRKERLEAADKMQDVVNDDLLKDRLPSYVSEYEVGQKSKNLFTEYFEKIRSSLSKRYDKIEKYFNYINLDETEINNIVRNVNNSTSYNSLLEEEKKLVDQILNQIDKAKNLSDLKRINTANNERILNTQLENTVLTNALKEIKAQVKLTRAEQIKKTSVAIAGKEGQEIADNFIREVSQLDVDYAAYKKSIEEFVEETGFRKTGKYAGDLNKLIQRFNGLSNENFTKKLLNVNDRDLLLYLKQKFPVVFEEIRRLNLKNIHKSIESSAEGSNMRLSIHNFLKKMEDLGPVNQELFFPGQVQKINDIRQVYTANPGIFNPSSTAAAQEIFANQSMLKKYGKQLFDKGPMSLVPTVLGDLKSYGQYMLYKNRHQIASIVEAGGNDKAAEIGFLKVLTKNNRLINADGFKTMVDYTRKAIEGAQLINKTVIDTIKNSPVIIPINLKPSEKDKEKLDKRVKEFGDNPSAMLDLYKNFNHYMDDHGMAIAAASAGAVSYLNSIRPIERKESPLDDPTPPSQFEKQNYDVALSLAYQPLMILEDIQNGTLNSIKLGHLQKLFPDLYANLRYKMMDELVNVTTKNEKIPYKTRMGLSLFLGTPLDSTMKPEGIMALQPKMAQTQQQQQQQAMMSMQQAVQAGGRQRGTMKNIGKLADQQLTPLQTRNREKQSVKV